ncbi:MAG: cysteine synthase family protein [Firmicutes bacterium]|nr:cysteine synthase family protein [Bacillota bacterium]
MGDIKSSILETIGNTPMVNLSRLTKHYGVEGRLLAKLEHLNPSSSKKDRIALHMIEQAEKDGRLKPGMTVIEETSGNTGNGLALVCAVKGYKFIAAMSEGNSVERMKMMRGLGADLLLVPQLPESTKGFVSGADLQKVEEAAFKYAEENGAYLCNQFHNRENNDAHALTTAKEIWEQCDGSLSYFVDFAGTGGSFGGTAQGLKQYNPDIKCIVVEPAKACAYGPQGVTDPAHRIQGGGYAKKLDLIDDELVDGNMPVSDEEAIEFARALSSLEGIFCGFSAGANACAAIKLLQGEAKGKDVVILISDSGLKYLSTTLYE